MEAATRNFYEVLFQDMLDDLIVLGTPLVQPDDQQLLTASVAVPVANRKLHRKRKKKTGI